MSKRGRCKYCSFAFGTKKVCNNRESKEYGREHRRYAKNWHTNKVVIEDDKTLHYCFLKK